MTQPEHTVSIRNMEVFPINIRNLFRIKTTKNNFDILGLVDTDMCLDLHHLA